jgi:hypothetical protein
MCKLADIYITYEQHLNNKEAIVSCVLHLKLYMLYAYQLLTINRNNDCIPNLWHSTGTADDYFNSWPSIGCWPIIG